MRYETIEVLPRSEAVNTASPAKKIRRRKIKNKDLATEVNQRTLHLLRQHISA
jgi:hypothetical protein